MKFENVKPGMVLYSIERYRMGNTSLRSISVSKITVIEVHEKTILASRDGNTPRLWYRHHVEKLRTKPPVLVRSAMCGQQRLATREELKAMKSGGAS